MNHFQQLCIGLLERESIPFRFLKGIELDV